jgi:hypothetical protein
MTEMWMPITLASFGLVALALTLAACLKGWQDWLSLKRMELSARREGETRSPAIERIEIADLKERIRKLESIASCVDL